MRSRNIPLFHCSSSWTKQARRSCCSVGYRWTSIVRCIHQTQPRHLQTVFGALQTDPHASASIGFNRATETHTTMPTPVNSTVTPVSSMVAQLITTAYLVNSTETSVNSSVISVKSTVTVTTSLNNKTVEQLMLERFTGSE